jgi:hypothetical protein
VLICEPFIEGDNRILPDFMGWFHPSLSERPNSVNFFLIIAGLESKMKGDMKGAE